MLSILRNMGGYLAARYDVRNERGATMVEYGLMVAFVALVVGVAASLLGGNVANLFNETGNSVGSTNVPTAPVTVP